jgi:hypothetical protein
VKHLPALDAVADVKTDERGSCVVDAKTRAVRSLEMLELQVGCAADLHERIDKAIAGPAPNS